MGFGMGFTDIFVGLAGLAAAGIAAPLGILVLLKVIVAVSAMFLGYIFAKDELFELCKQIFLRRVFKIKNPNTGEYESLKGYQQFLIVLLSPFSLVAGCCIATLAFKSVPAAFSGTYVLPFLGAVPIIPLICGVFVLCLATAAYFLTIKKIISHIDDKKIMEYMASLKKQDNEGCCYRFLRLALEAGKWLISLAVMTTVAVGGYYLFKDKAIDTLKTLWLGMAAIKAEKIASYISFSYSSIKLVFGVEKVSLILQSAASWVKGMFSSKKGEVASLPPNRIQQQSQSSQAVYNTAAMVGLFARTAATAAFYNQAAENNQLSSPKAIAGTAGVFIFSMCAVPVKNAQQKETPTPLECKRPTQ